MMETILGPDTALHRPGGDISMRETEILLQKVFNYRQLYSQSSSEEWKQLCNMNIHIYVRG